MQMRDDTFWWAAGIEDTFIPQPAKSTGRSLDEYELTQHYRAWREDLALAASLGLSHLRYGIPWHRVNPSPGTFDWSWTDEVLEHMVRDLRIQPIVDLMHYGCPLWLEREFANPDYPARVAEYAAAFVERYGTLTRSYTPLNEPLVNTRFSGYTAAWPPYLRGWRGWTRVLVALAEGMSRTVAAIRSLQPEATIVHVEATPFIGGDETDDHAVLEAVDFTRERQFLPTELLLGWVDPAHRFWPWLLESGASEEALRRLVDHPQRIDVMGTNFYPGISVSRLEPGPRGPIRRRYLGGAAELEWVMRTWHARFGSAVMVTETSSNASIARRARWMDESIELLGRLRDEGFPALGYTWWPMFSLVTWAYRRGRGPLTAYLADMGLWDLRDDGSGTLPRVPTPLVERYRGHVMAGAPNRAAKAA